MTLHNLDFVARQLLDDPRPQTASYPPHLEAMRRNFRALTAATVRPHRVSTTRNNNEQTLYRFLQR